MPSKPMDSIHGCGAPSLGSTVPEELTQIAQEGVMTALTSPSLPRCLHPVYHGLSMSLGLLFISGRPVGNS